MKSLVYNGKGNRKQMLSKDSEGGYIRIYKNSLNIVERKKNVRFRREIFNLGTD